MKRIIASGGEKPAGIHRGGDAAGLQGDFDFIESKRLQNSDLFRRSRIKRFGQSHGMRHALCFESGQQPPGETSRIGSHTNGNPRFSRRFHHAFHFFPVADIARIDPDRAGFKLPAIKPNTRYRLSFYIRTEGVKGTRKDSGTGSYLYFPGGKGSRGFPSPRLVGFFTSSDA